MNANIIIGRVLKTLVILIGCLFQAAVNYSPNENFSIVVFLLHRHEKTTTSTIKRLIHTLKKLVNLSAVNCLGIEIGKTTTNYK
jgi:hypothetical protein